MLQLENACVSYAGVPALDRVSLEVADGEVLAVLGPSGCGKSTLLRVIAGLEPLSSGTVRYDGQDLAGVPTHRRGFALMFQDGQLFPHLTVARNIGYALRLRRRPRPEIAGRVAQLLELVGLPGYAARLPATLSGGERQRVALARSLAVDPRLLLLDEPLSALDAGLRERLAAEVRDIVRAAGTTTLFVTHDHEEAFAVADRIAVLRDGGLVQAGPIGEVWAHPAGPETALFLGYARVLEGSAAGVVLSAAGLPDAPAVALRRSALAVSGAGPLSGVVVEARATPDLLRVVVEIPRVGLADAIAPSGTHLGPGDLVALTADPTRLAVLPEQPPFGASRVRP